MTFPAADSLLARLPPVRGRIAANVPLAPLCWFRVGGPAEVLFRPEDEADLAAFLADCPADIPVTVMGVGSNLLVRDGGVPGVVIKLAKGFARLERISDTDLQADSGALDLTVALTAQSHGLAGLEFLSGIPGTIGGALRMNAGAYGGEMKDCVQSARAVDRQGRFHDLTPADLGFSYRRSSVPDDWIFLGAILRGTPGDPQAIAARIADIRQSREDSQPVRSRTGGSTFANPSQRRAWELIDAAGCRGLTIGGAQMSEKHCNFMINQGTASAADLETLGETVRTRVHATSGIDLHWEIRRIGQP